LIEKWRDDSGGPPDGFRSMYRPAMVAFHPARRGWVREVKWPRLGFCTKDRPDDWVGREETFWVASVSLGITARGRRHRSQPAVAFSTFTERRTDGVVKWD